jgi:hypothetical protein
MFVSFAILHIKRHRSLNAVNKLAALLPVKVRYENGSVTTGAV